MLNLKKPSGPAANREEEPAHRAQAGEGSGADAGRGSWDANRLSTLHEREGQLKKYRTRQIRVGFLLLTCGCIATGISTYYAISHPGWRPVAIPALLYGFFLIAAGIYMLSEAREVSIEIDSIRDDRDLIEFKNQPVTVLAYKLFRVNQLEVKRHYSQTLSQGNVIFAVGIFCIVSGLAIVAVTLRLVSNTEATETSTKLITGGVGAVGGILANYIAYIFLRMFKETSTRLRAQQDRLVATHFLHFGNYLAARVDNAGLRDETLSCMAKVLAENGGTTKEPPEKLGKHPGESGQHDSRTTDA
ncbi:hypothetical protein [Streptomyces sp. YS-3]|uniref:hypothetical protein n=1 Tax=Streptomyces sp. YS-3 TaxID=3381352 RepID=UPI0038623F9B